MNQNIIFFNSLTDSQKINLISTHTGIKPCHIDLTNLTYSALDKWTKKGINDLRLEKQGQNKK